MKVWKLSPTVQSSSKPNGFIRIRAVSEQRAREVAENAFETKTKVKNTIHGVNWSELDWHDKNAVECLLEADYDISTTEGILDIE